MAKQRAYTPPAADEGYEFVKNGLIRDCFKATGLGLFIGAFATGCGLAMYDHLNPNGISHWMIGLVLTIALACTPILALLFARRHERLFVRGYGLMCLSGLLLYFIGGLFFFFPFIFLPIGTPLRIGLLTASISYLVYLTVLAIYDTRKTERELDFLNKAFVDVGPVIQYDLKHNNRWWQKHSREGIKVTDFHVWIIMAAYPIAPVAGMILGPGNVPSWGYLVFPVITQLLVISVWRKSLAAIAGMFVYPIYLELKTGKPVIEVRKQKVSE